MGPRASKSVPIAGGEAAMGQPCPLVLFLGQLTDVESCQAELNDLSRKAMCG